MSRSPLPIPADAHSGVVSSLTDQAWEDYPGRVVVISGPSGVGKTTLVKLLLADPELPLRLSVSATTRPIRAGERDGVDYHYVPRSWFEEALRTNALLEWAEVHGNCYGTPAEPVRAWASAGIWPLLDIDVQGGIQVAQRVPSAILIWIEPPDLDLLEQRLRGRGTEDHASLERRLTNARREMELAHHHYPAEWFLRNEEGQAHRSAAVLADRLRQAGCGGLKPDAG